MSYQILFWNDILYNNFLKLSSILLLPLKISNVKLELPHLSIKGIIENTDFISIWSQHFTKASRASAEQSFDERHIPYMVWQHIFFKSANMLYTAKEARHELSRRKIIVQRHLCQLFKSIVNIKFKKSPILNFQLNDFWLPHIPVMHELQRI